MSGEVVHFEIPSENVDRARKFYKATFGWKMQEAGGMEYTLVSTAPVDGDGRVSQPGAINGGLAPRGGPLLHPVITIMVDEIDSTLKAIENHGGKTVQKKTQIGDGTIGYSAYFRDPEGNVIGLFTPNRG